MKTIPLTQGQVALVDDSDFEELTKYRWYARRNKNGAFYAARSCPVPRGRKLYMHRALLLGVPEVDHVNRNTLDNQRHNLRPATHSQNLHNIERPRDNTSGF